MLAPSPGSASAGLSLRRALLAPLAGAGASAPDFLELAPENWIGIGGRYGKALKACGERYRIGCHGLSLSLGGLAPLNTTLLKAIRRFLDAMDALYYSEHLSAADDGRPLYDLLPMPFTDEAVHYVAQRIRTAQDVLERKIAVENISYYITLNNVLTEAEFINAVVQEADCLLLLDVNNLYVNSVNQHYDAGAFLRAMPAERVLYYHVAGHKRVSDTLCIDTHGQAVIDPVWQLLDQAYDTIGVKPTVLERESHLPPFADLMAEIDGIRAAQSRSLVPHRVSGRDGCHG